MITQKRSQQCTANPVYEPSQAHGPSEIACLYQLPPRQKKLIEFWWEGGRSDTFLVSRAWGWGNEGRVQGGGGGGCSLGVGFMF